MTDKKKKTLRFRIKELLHDKNMTTGQFAEKAGLHYNTALALVNNNYKRVGLETLAEICLALDVEVKDLFTWD
jgi:DNA-binding Xre family transcriptional regulator